jgi:hypothetical protein
MRVLVACEHSGTVRDAFAKRGHDAMSCDLLDTDSPGNHYKGDVRDVLPDQWDMVIAHPDCTFLTVSGIHWNTNPKSYRFGGHQTEDAVKFARMFIDGPETAHIHKRVTENPISILSTRVRKPNQIIQPYQFGADASKATCFWLDGVDPLVIDRAARYPGRLVDWKGKLVERWSNQTDSGQNKLAPSADRWKLRSKTYQGIADAMAERWG